MRSYSLGRAGEESAALFLTEHGCKILARNLRIGHYEIDILAQDDRHLIFAEVKTRRAVPGHSVPFGRPANAVNLRKRDCLREAVRLYWKEQKYAFPGLTPNIDVIEVYVDPYSDVYRVLDIKRYPNAVTGMKG